MVRPGLKEEFRSTLYDHCVDDWQPEFNRHFFPRECCARHNLYDQKTPGLFKLEKQGVGMVGLCSKTHCLKVLDAADKVAVKGVNKKGLVNVYEKMKDVLETGRPGVEVNRGFRMRPNPDTCANHDRRVMHTYTQAKTAFSYLYCKRRVHEDGIHTEPLDLVLRPPKRK
jgi:hypothetical protein